MTNVANRHRRAALKAAPVSATKYRYLITDPHHKPDLRGQLGGVKVERIGGKQYVTMTERQARFYCDQGKLAKVIVGKAKV